MASLTISQQEYEKLRQSGQTKEQIFAKYSTDKPGILTRAANAVTDLVGARGIADQFGASLAEARLKSQGNVQAANLVENPSMRTVVGSAIQTGANFLPGVGKGASLLAKVGAGAATGYAFDVGANLQNGRQGTEAFRPGIGTVAGGSIPVLSSILGYAFKNVPAWAAKKLEDVNLRLTPVERQNLERKGQDIAAYLAEQKVVGTPAQRYAKVTGLYNNMEKNIQNVVSKSGATFVGNGASRTDVLKYPTKDVLHELSKIPDAFVDDPELNAEAASAVKKLSQYMQSNYGDDITAIQVNNLKRNHMNRAFAKNATDVVSDSRLAIGSLFKKLNDDSIPALEALNREYGLIIASRRALQKATTRAQIGLTGKLAGMAVGGIVGNTIGGPVGAAAGTVIGPTIGKALVGTPTRSAIGAGAQSISNLASYIQNLPTDRLGNVSQKAVLDYLESLKQ